MSGFTDLTHLFDPRSVVLVGASERAASVGGRTLSNIIDHSDFRGTLHLVNASRPEVRGLACHRRVADRVGRAEPAGHPRDAGLRRGHALA